MARGVSGNGAEGTLHSRWPVWVCQLEYSMIAVNWTTLTENRAGSLRHREEAYDPARVPRVPS